MRALNRAISVDRLEGRHERLFVRVLGRNAEAIFFNIPADWGDFDLSGLRADTAEGFWWSAISGRREPTVLEVASTRLRDGTLVQVGKSSEARDELLQHFRSRVAVVFACILTIAVVGGTLLTNLGLAPVRDLAATVRSIVQTGNLESRVTVRQTGDALDELGVLVNGMLDRIQALIAGMRGSLDNVAHDLRTPLMRLRGVVGDRAARRSDPDAVREALAQCARGNRAGDAMLTTLMDISEAETGTHAAGRASGCARRTWCARPATLYADVAEDKGITLASASPDDL